MIVNKTPSIRQFLLTSMIIALIGFSGISGMISWLSSKHEMDEVYNANLVQVAKAIEAHHATLTASALKEPALIGTSKGFITTEEDFFVRIKDDHDQLVYISHPDVNLPSSDTVGFSKIIYQNQKWRVFIIKSGRDKIEVAQSIKFRNKAINEVSRSLTIPQLLFIPLFGIFIWFIIGKSLYPLAVLSTSINQRKTGLLDPFSLNEIPVEIHSLVNALNTLLDHLKKMIFASKQFTSDAAHELRTPLTALKLQLANLERAKDDAQKEDALKQLNGGIERSIALVQQLLTLARMEPDSVDLAFEPIILSDLVKSAIEDFLPFSTIKNIDLGITKNNDFPILGNVQALKILINNLIDNAVHYSPKNSIVNISIIKVDTYNILQIKDEGPGIAKNELGRVFDRFFRGTNHDVSGTGLGLSIVKEIVNHHKAEIILENSRTGSGLIVEIRFPLLQI